MICQSFLTDSSGYVVSHWIFNMHLFMCLITTCIFSFGLLFIYCWLFHLFGIILYLFMYSGYEHFVKCMCWKYLPPLAEEGLGGERETKRESELGGKGEERWEGGGTKRKRDKETQRETDIQLSCQLTKKITLSPLSRVCTTSIVNQKSINTYMYISSSIPLFCLIVYQYYKVFIM